MRGEPYEFAALATYNAEVWRGIVHTVEYDERMRAEQERFDKSMERSCVVCRRPATMTLARWDRPVSEGVHSCEDCWDLVQAVHA